MRGLEHDDTLTPIGDGGAVTRTDRRDGTGRGGAPASGRREPSSVRGDVAALAATVLATAVLLVPVLRLTDVDLTAPLSYTQDGTFYTMVAQSLEENDWWYENPRMGAPAGQELYDFPQADTLLLALMKALGPIAGGNPALTVNLAFLLGFPAVAATTYIVLRQLRVRPPMSAAGAILYAFTPYHLGHGANHVLLSGYFLLPLALLVVVRQLGERPALTRPGADGRLRPSLLEGRSLFALTACLLITTTGVYYAVFVALLLGVVLAVQLVRRVHWPAALSTVALIGVIGAGLVAALLPSLLYRAENGPNPEAANRAYIEVEFFALKPVLLLLPIVDHRLDVLRGPAETVNGGAFPGEPSMQLGALGAIGLVGALLVALGRASAAHDDHDGRRVGHATDPLLGRLGVLSAAAILLATSAGFGALLGVLGITEIRAWARMTIVIAFFAVAAVAVVADRAAARRQLAPGVLWGLAALLAVVGVVDQTGAVDVARAQAIAATWESDAAFVAGIERQLGDGASVFQLPHVPFPENPVVESMTDYDHAKGFIHSDTLRWSYGAMKGRGTSFSERVAGEPVPQLLRDVVSAGFSGLYVDRFGYADRAASLEAEVAAELGVEPQISRDQRLAFFDLRGYAQTLLGDGATGAAPVAAPQGPGPLALRTGHTTVGGP